MSDANGSVQAGNPAEWVGTVPADLKPVVEARGWHTRSANEVAVEAIKSFANAEKLIGTKRLEAPQDGWDDVKWGEFHKALGVPDDPAGYKLPDTVKIDNQEYLAAAQQWAKDAGLTPKQFANMVEKNNGFVAAAAEAMAKSEANELAAADAALRKEWGAAYDVKEAAAKGAVAALQSKLGLTPEFLSQVEGKLGYAPLIKLFATLAEDYGIGREGRAAAPGAGGVTPEQASAELRQLNADPAFRKALSDRSDPGHADALGKWERLIELGGKLSG